MTRLSAWPILRCETCGKNLGQTYDPDVPAPVAWCWEHLPQGEGAIGREIDRIKQERAEALAREAGGLIGWAARKAGEETR